MRSAIRPSVARFCAPRQPDSIYDSDREDTSWHNDAMPSFVNERRMLRLWINYSDVSLQDIQGGKRFLLVREHADHSPDESDELFASDSWSDVLAFLASVP